MECNFASLLPSCFSASFYPFVNMVRAIPGVIVCCLSSQRGNGKVMKKARYNTGVMFNLARAASTNSIKSVVWGRNPTLVPRPLFCSLDPPYGTGYGCIRILRYGRVHTIGPTYGFMRWYRMNIHITRNESSLSSALYRAVGVPSDNSHWPTPPLIITFS